MITLGFEILLALSLAAPAQTSTTTGVLQLDAAGATVDRKPIDEQIEVMRAILVRRLAPGAAYTWVYDSGPAASQNNAMTSYQSVLDAQHSLYGPLATSPGQRTYVAAGPTYAEGVYLEGFGVVFNVTMAATKRDPRPGSESPRTTPAISEWDRMQRQLRGEKTPESAATVAKEPPLGDVVLKLMSQNGKNFSALRDDDKVTIAITFRGENAGEYRNALSPLTGTHTIVPSNVPASPLNAMAVAGAPHGQSARDLELLGELHLKQGQTDQALDAFRRAVLAIEKEAKDSGDEAEVTKAAKRRADLYGKLAQAFIAAGKFDQAREALERAKETSSKLTAGGKTPVAKSPAIILPARMTITASKRVLDQVGSGAMSLDEFRKVAKVDYTPSGKVAE